MTKQGKPTDAPTTDVKKRLAAIENKLNEIQNKPPKKIKDED